MSKETIKDLVNFEELGNSIKEREQKSLKIITDALGYRIGNTRFDYPEFLGLGGMVQINTIDGITGLKRRFKVVAKSEVPNIRMYITDIDNKNIYPVDNVGCLVADRPHLTSRALPVTLVKSDSRFLNEIISMIHIIELTKAIWKVDDDSDKLVWKLSACLEAYFHIMNPAVIMEDDKVIIYFGRFPAYTLLINDKKDYITHITRSSKNRLPEVLPMESINIMDSFMLLFIELFNSSSADVQFGSGK